MENKNNGADNAVRVNMKAVSRQQALQIAKDLNPVRTNYSQALTQSGSNESVSVTKLLQDADKIYEWLIKEV